MDNYAFIDGQNLYLAIKELGWKVDYKKFRVYLKEKYHVTKAYLLLLSKVAMSKLSLISDLRFKIEYKKKRTPRGRNLKGDFSS